MNIKKQEVGMYGLMLSTEECFNDMMQGGNKMHKLIEAAEDCPVVYQDPQGRYQMILFLTPEDRQAAHATAKKIGFESAAVVAQRIYVDAKYLKK